MLYREEILQYIQNNYHTMPEYLWKTSPKDAVFRHNDNKKWYGLLMNLSKEKLGLGGKEKIDILTIKCYPEMIGTLRKEKWALPAYHMNKEYWLTILLDADFSNDTVLNLIDLSYELTK